MKLARIGERGQERPAIVDEDGRIRSLAGHLSDLAGAMLGPDELARIAALDPRSLPEVEGESRYGAPVSGIGKVVGIGLNYIDHADEAGMEIPKEPIVFLKATSAIAGPNDDVAMPRDCRSMDWEVELGVVIGTTARYVARERALNHVAGYVLVNDLTARDHQFHRGGSWDKGKGHDGFGPIGPWLVTREEVREVGKLDLFLDVSGERRQTGNTASMIFDVPFLISYVSQFMTLDPGDILITGTPAGVGMGMKPPVYLAVGDEIHLGISGLGEQRQRIVPPL